MTDENRFLSAELAGVQFAFPANLRARLEAKPESLSRFLDIAQQAKECETRSGVAFDNPIFILDSDSIYAFRTQMAAGNDGKPLAMLQVPIAALEAEPPMDRQVVEGILAHELGHAAQKEQSNQLSDVFFWKQPLNNILASSVILRENPGHFKEITAAVGGEESYLEKADALFAQVKDGLKDFLGKTTNNGQANSAEAIIDTLATDAGLKPLLAKAARFGNDHAPADFDALDEAAGNIIQTAFKNGLTPQNFVVSKENAPEAQVNFLKLLNGLHGNVKHAQEYMADDFSAQHATSPVKYLQQLKADLGETESYSHPKISLRIERADRLDTCRITMLDTTGEINEAAAVKRVNREMTALHQPTPTKETGRG